MNDKKSYALVFSTSGGNKTTITIPYAKENLTESQVKTAMNKITGSQMYIAGTGLLSTPLSANLVMVEYGEIDL